MVELIGLSVLCVVFLGLWLWQLKRHNSFKEEYYAMKTEVAQAESVKSGLELQLNELKQEKQNMQAELQELHSQKVRLEEQNQTVQTALKEQKELLETSKTQLTDTFKSLASQALEGNSKQFMDLAKNLLEKESSVAKKDLEQRTKSIDHMLNPLKETLDRYQTHVKHMEQERQRSYSKVEEELKRVVDVNQNLATQTTALKDALKRPHVRGRWGELQLKNCIELSGMSEFADVTFQDYNDTEDGGRLIPDMTVRMPGGRTVIVDAKTPIEAFLESLEAPTEDEKQAAMLRHGKHVKEHVRSLGLKDYGKHLKNAADFTVMFLPNESFLYAALEVEPDLVEFALQKKILIATPPTLIGLLKVIRFGWSEERMAENAAKISDTATELHKRICEFVDGFLSIEKHLDKAKEEFDKSKSRLERRVLSQTRKIENLGIKSIKELPEGMGEAEAEDAEAVEAKPNASEVQ